MSRNEVLVKKLLGAPVEDNDPMNDLTAQELTNLMTGGMFSVLADGHVFAVDIEERLDYWEAVRCGA